MHIVYPQVKNYKDAACVCGCDPWWRQKHSSFQRPKTAANRQTDTAYRNPYYGARLKRNKSSTTTIIATAKQQQQQQEPLQNVCYDLICTCDKIRFDFWHHKTSLVQSDWHLAMRPHCTVYCIVNCTTLATKTLRTFNLRQTRWSKSRLTSFLVISHWSRGHEYSYKITVLWQN